MKTLKKNIQLSFWSYASELDPMQSALKTAINNFNQSNTLNVTINGTFIEGHTYSKKISVDFATKKAADIVGMRIRGKLNPFVVADKICPLNTFLDSDPEWKAGFLPDTFSDITFNNEIYGIPLIKVYGLIYYNMDIFREFNLQPPATYKEFKEMIHILYSNGIIPISVSLPDAWVIAMLAEYIIDRLGGLETFRQLDFPHGWIDTNIISAFKMLMELKNINAFPAEIETLDTKKARLLFEEEKAAMYIMGSWEAGYWAFTSKIKKKVNIFPFPQIKGGNGSIKNWLGSVEQVYSINSECKYKESAIAFLKYLSSKNFQKILLESYGYLPVVNINVENVKLQPLINSIYDQTQQAENIICFYDTYFGSIIGEAFNEAVSAVINQNKDPFTELSIIKKKVEKYSKNGY